MKTGVWADSGHNTRQEGKKGLEVSSGPAQLSSLQNPEKFWDKILGRIKCRYPIDYGLHCISQESNLDCIWAR